MTRQFSPAGPQPDARRRILTAATSIFARLGFYGASVRDISQLAAVSTGLIFHHFEGKEALWTTVCDLSTEALLAALQPHLDPAYVDAQTIPRLLGAYMQYWRDNPEAFRLQLWKVLEAPQLQRQARAERLNQIIAPLFLAAQRQGFLSANVAPGQSMATAAAMIQYKLHSALEMNVALCATTGCMPDDKAFVDYVYRLIQV